MFQKGPPQYQIMILQNFGWAMLILCVCVCFEFVAFCGVVIQLCARQWVILRCLYGVREYASIPESKID